MAKKSRGHSTEKVLRVDTATAGVVAKRTNQWNASPILPVGEMGGGFLWAMEKIKIFIIPTALVFSSLVQWYHLDRLWFRELFSWWHVLSYMPIKGMAMALVYIGIILSFVWCFNFLGGGILNGHFWIMKKSQKWKAPMKTGVRVASLMLVVMPLFLFLPILAWILISIPWFFFSWGVSSIMPHTWQNAINEYLLFPHQEACFTKDGALKCSTIYYQNDQWMILSDPSTSKKLFAKKIDSSFEFIRAKGD